MFDYTQPHAAQALVVVEKLQQAGFIAFLAGGCVRDAMLGRVPKDFDVATDATPDTVRDLFGRRRTLAFGASFGVIGVLGVFSDALTPTEVATFRSDGEYSDGRRPDSIRFGSAEQDALRRDFTINGMFYDPVAAKLIDFVGGEADLKAGIIRAIGDPEKRISEDKLRMLRAVRFAAALGFELHGDTQAATCQHAQEVTIVSGERIGAEVRRMFGGVSAARAIRLLATTNLIGYIWPSYTLTSIADSSFASDVQRLASGSIENSFVVIVAMLISRMGTEPEVAIDEITTRWKLSCDEQRAIEHAIRSRDTLLNADRLPWSMVQPIVSARDADTSIEAAAGWAYGFELPGAGISFCKVRRAWPLEQLDPPPLLTGDTLRMLGYKPGPSFRDVLQAIRNSQLDLRITTELEAIELAKQIYSGLGH